MYGEYEPETLEKLHRAEAEMFKDFADLCERNKIECNWCCQTPGIYSMG